jgi:hypothetical protein
MRELDEGGTERGEAGEEVGLGRIRNKDFYKFNKSERVILEVACNVLPV